VLASKRVIEKTLQQVQLDKSSLNSNFTVLQHTIDRKNLELKSAGEELARAEARRLAETTALETRVKTLKTDAERASESDAQSRAAVEALSKAKRALFKSFRRATHVHGQNTSTAFWSLHRPILLEARSCWPV
jgi:hypothetical protein